MKQSSAARRDDGSPSRTGLFGEQHSAALLRLFRA
jgi:hypothetical protein